MMTVGQISLNAWKSGITSLIAIMKFVGILLHI